MSYTINLTNGNVYTTIPDGTINQSSSMTLIGKNYAGYGQFLDDNFIHLLENSANGTAPVAPLVGQLWFNTTLGALQVYNGSIFKALGGATSSGTPPAAGNSVIGDLWYDTINDQLNVWTGSAWLLVGPTYTASTGLTGAIPATIVDGTGTSHVVVELYAGATLVGIIAKDAPFQLATALSPGFPIGTTIYPGIQLGNNVNGQIPTFTGTATNTLNLNGLASTQFIRSDINSNTTGALSVLNNSGLFVGAGSIFNIAVSGAGNTTASLTNSATNGNINLSVTSGTLGVIPALTINGSTGQVTGLQGGILANNSLALNSLTSSQFMRTDVNTSTTGTISAAGNISTGGSFNAPTGTVNSANVVTGVLQVNNNALILGNLSVQGNVNFIDSTTVVTNSLVLEVGNNAPSLVSLNGAGLAAGPATGPFTYWQYSAPANAWSTNVGISAAGNIYAQNVFGNISGNVSGSISTTGNVYALNVSASGTVTGQYLVGDGWQVANVTAGNVNGVVSSAASASNFASGGFSMGVSGGKIYFSYNGSHIASLDSSGNFTSLNNITAFNTP